MSRPSAQVLAQAQANISTTVQVLEHDNFWVLTYQDRPAGIRELIATTYGFRKLYPRVAFNNRAHCVRLSEKLNALFETTDFSYTKINFETESEE